MSVATHAYPSAKAAAEACATRAASLLEDAIRKSGRATFALSGGSTPAHMFDALAAMPLDWTRIHWFWVDERMVPPEDKESNFHLTKQHLFDRISPPPVNIHRIFGELPPDQALAGYEADLRNFFELGPADLPSFDVIHRGIGPEAHTASLFPGSPLIADRTSLAAVVTTPKPPNPRVTLLRGVLERAGHTLMLVAGEDKVDAVRSVFHEPFDPSKYPAQIASVGAAAADWYLDELAARGL